MEDYFAKFLYGTSFKAPSQSQLSTNLMAPGDVMSNPDLKPEKAESFEFVLGKSGKTFSVSASFFLTSIEDKVELVPRKANLTSENISRVDSSGFEVESSFSLWDFYGYLNASYQKSKVKEQSGSENAEYDTYTYPAFMIKSGISYTIPAIYTMFSAEGRYIGKRASSYQNTEIFSGGGSEPYYLDSYSVFDLSISSYKFYFVKNYESRILLKVSNVFNKEFNYPGFTTNVNKGYDIPGEGRSFLVEINQNF